MNKDKYFGLSKRIFPWKEPSEFEQALAEAATENPEIKRLYAQYYRHLNKKYYEGGYAFARKLFDIHSKDFIGEDFDHIYEDMVYCLHKYGLSFEDYCVFNLHRKSESQRNSYVSDKLRYYYCDILNAPDVEALMTNKYSCYLEYQPFYKRDMVLIERPEDKDKFQNFLKNHPRFIYKPIGDHSGHGIAIIDSSETDMDGWFEKITEEAPGVVEELMIQGEELNRINPTSVNTCRIMTFTIGDEVTLFAGVLRMGVGDSTTDNAGAGGIYASIDTETGIIRSDARNYANDHYLYHPTTGTLIPGFRLPEWNEAVELIKQMARHRKGTTLIAWDIAYTDKGWCMVEANDNGAWQIIQSNLDNGKKRELYKLMDRYFSQTKKTLS